MNGLSLFTGAGIGEIAFKLIFINFNYRTIGYVEWDEYCQDVIRARIADGILDDAPIFGDIRHFNAAYASLYAGKVDWLSAGFPCQPFSTASRGNITSQSMWGDVLRITRSVTPRYVFAENVQRRAIDEAVITLREIGYNAQARPYAAADVGADHIRERWWLLGNPNYKSKSTCAINDEAPRLSPFGEDCQKTVWWKHYPGIMGVDDGVAHRVDRLKAIGNGWVPQVVARILNVHTAR